MKKIILATFGSLGDIHPMMAVALELQRRGHTPVIATSEYYGGKIRDAGIAFHPTRPHLEPGDKDLLRAAMDERRGPEQVVRRMIMPALRGTYEDLSEAVSDADVLVAADLLYAAPIVAEKTGIPWLAATMAPLTFLSEVDPPVLPQAPWLATLARVSKPAYVAIMRTGQWATRHWAAPVYELRRDLELPKGLEPIFSARKNARAILAMFSRVLATPSADWPGNTYVTGFAYYDQHEPMPQALRDFLDAGDPPIVFTLGSAAVFDPGPFYRESIDAARRLKRRAVLLVGPSPERLPALTADVQAFAYAPYSELFPRAAAIVHQGGAGTTGQALRSGRPMLVVPFSHDQPDNAARLVRLGVARTLRRRRYTAERAEHALRALLEDGSYQRRASAVADEVLKEDGAATAADLILTHS